MSSSKPKPTGQARRTAPWGERLARRFADWPLIRLLLASRALRLLVILGFLVVGGVGVGLGRWWTTSPPGIKPVVRISLLDRVQVWSLRRRALAAEARGDFENARSAWRAAVANNRCDLANVRALLALIPKTSEPAESAGLVLGMGSGLLLYGRTNVADLELVGTVWNRCDLHARTYFLLGQQTNLLSPALQRLQMVAMFRGEYLTAFTNLLANNLTLREAVNGLIAPGSGPVRDDPTDIEFAAVGLGYLAGWGPRDMRGVALARLRELAQRPGFERLALEVEMMVQVELGEVAEAEVLLRRLESTGRATIALQTAYWRLLSLQGRKAEAVTLARDANPAPRSDADIMRLVSTYAMLGMNEDAEQLCRRYFSDPPWIEYAAWVHARLLINLERWADLRQLAYRIRTFPMVMDALGGTSAYFEGLAEWREGYRENARRAFELAAQAGFNSPQMASEVADTLMSIGEIKFAEPILLRDSVRQALSNDRAYLMSLIKCAFYLRNTHYLADAATRLYRMYPTDPMIMNNYAASLLLVRTNVDQALIHTLRLSKAFPDNPDTKVNHATALIMNQRLGEADALLGEISPTLMGSDSSRAQYYMALFELRLRQGRKSEAQAALREVKTTELYPIQVEWIEKTALPELEALPEPPTGAGTG